MKIYLQKNKKFHQNKWSVNNRPLVLLFLRGKCAFGHQFQGNIYLFSVKS